MNLAAWMLTVSKIKFHKLSDRELDVVDRVVKGLLKGIQEQEAQAAQQRRVIDVSPRWTG